MQPLVQRVLFATDFSVGAEWAQRQVLLWAKDWGAELLVAHVVEVDPGMSLDDPVLREYVEARKKQAISHLEGISAWCRGHHVTAETVINVGNPSQSIVEIGRKSDSDVIILGTRGISGLEHLFMGSTAERVMRTAPCPVLAVPEAGSPDVMSPTQLLEPASPYQHIVLPVDFSDCSLDALEYAIQVTKKFKAKLTILHVLEPDSFGLDFTLRQVEERHLMREGAESWLSELKSSLQAQDIEVTCHVLGGAPKESIHSWAQKESCDLMIMGTHGRKGLSLVACGSVAEYVLRHVRCPILTVKSPKFAPEQRSKVPERRAHMFQFLHGLKETYGVDP